MCAHTHANARTHARTHTHTHTHTHTPNHPNSQVESRCCDLGSCKSPCNITVVDVDDATVTVQLPGQPFFSAPNLAEETSISLSLSPLLNLWAGNKEGFDISLLLIDGISTVLQSKDVDGPELLAGICLLV
jgi:hypothetical protein